MYDFILSNLQIYERLVIFFGTLFWGDEVVYILSFLSGVGLVNVFNILFFGFLGNAGCDVFWFSVARSGIFSKLVNKIQSKQNKRDSNKIIKKEKRHLFVLLILSKFFMGTRLVTLFYIARKRNISVKKFLLYNSLAVIIWISFVATILFFVGRSAAVAFSDVEDTVMIINVVVFSLVGLFLMYKFVVPRIISRFFDNKS
ncbi:MAG: hypothetical protein ABIF18_03155 [archaeon]